MPSVNSTIVKADYNSIRDKIVNVLGTGSGNTGWGQDSKIVSSAVSESSKVTINEWANLRLDIINSWKHINGSNPVTAQVIEGQTVRYTSSFTPDTGTLDVPQRQYDVWADTIVTNRFLVGAGESALSSVQSTSRDGSWITQSSCIVTFTFPTANEARYFFNSGGQIRISGSRSGGTTSSQNTSWTSLLSTIGTQGFGGNNPGTGTSPSNGLNWYRCTNSFQTYYTGSASSPYGSNNLQLQARCTDVTSNTTGTSKSGEIRILFNDGYVDPATSPHTPSTVPPEDYVDGVLTANVSYLYATGIMVPTSALFTVTQPTVTIGSITAA